MIEGKTKSVILCGKHAVGAACTFLLGESTPFEVEPYPNDQWRITVKDTDRVLHLVIMRMFPRPA